MRVLIDYRPALRQRSGVGEYVFQLSRALLAEAGKNAAGRPLALMLFSSSWKDRFDRQPDLAGATIVDRRVPVSVLNAAWHRFEWPPAEVLTSGRFDVAHSPHPLLLPSRAAARVVTIHDLYFLTHPERTEAEVRRDYPALTRAHAHRADGIIVPSQFTAARVVAELGVAASQISVCPHGAPEWTPRSRLPRDGYVLCFGTLEPRKNVGALLDAYESLLSRSRGRRHLPDLLLAGHATEAARPWLERIAKPPLFGHVRHIGYVEPSRRQALYEGARLLVQPSFEEGFGFPVLEAMTVGVPVVAADRGALPEVLGNAGTLVEPDDTDQLATSIEQLIDDDALSEDLANRGVLRSRQFDWRRAAVQVYDAYLMAMGQKACALA